MQEATKEQRILESALRRELTWTATGDPNVPWRKELSSGDIWQVRLNDFPDEPLYTLLMNGEAIGDFYDWPSTWTRP